MEIIQKRFSNKATFIFGEDKLKYTIKDSGGSRTFSVEYDAIPDEYGEAEERNTLYRNAAILWVGIGVIQIVVGLLQHGKVQFSLWFVLGILSYVVYMIARTRYSTIDTSKGRIFVMKNRQHDIVLKEFTDRRRAQWRRWYGEVNLENDPDKEIRKFHWLKDHQVLSEEECQAAIERVERFHDLGSESTPETAAGPTIN